MISNHDNQRCRGTKDHIRKEKDVCLKIYRYKGIRTGFSKIRELKKKAIIMYFGMVIMKIAKYLLKLYSAIKVFIMPFTPS
jgi:hypothetical protein